VALGGFLVTVKHEKGSHLSPKGGGNSLDRGTALYWPYLVAREETVKENNNKKLMEEKGKKMTNYMP